MGNCAKGVHYADDFVICCRASAAEAMAAMRSMMLKLTVNETKTRLCALPDGAFDFLDYTSGRCNSHRTGAAYLGYVAGLISRSGFAFSGGSAAFRRSSALGSTYKVGVRVAAPA
jgi:hypothetical protein